jgi:hypothetical protein
MKTSILALAMGVASACPTTAYANENRNIIEEFFFGSDFSHRAHEETAGAQSGDPFIPVGPTGCAATSTLVPATAALA